MSYADEKSYFLLHFVFIELMSAILHKHIDEHRQYHEVDKQCIPRKPIRRVDNYIKATLPYLTTTIFVERPQVEGILTGRKVHIVCATHRIGRFPLFIVVLQHVLISDSVQRRKINGRKRNGERILIILQIYPPRVVDVYLQKRTFPASFHRLI